MSKKLTATVKVERCKKQIARALNEAKFNSNRQEAMGFIVGTLSNVYAILDSDRDDVNAIAHLAFAIMEEVLPTKSPVAQQKLQFLGEKYEQTSFNDKE